MTGPVEFVTIQEAGTGGNECRSLKKVVGLLDFGIN